MRISPRALKQALLPPLDSYTCRQRITAHNASINAFVRVSDVPVQEREREGKGRLEGWTVAVKDNICTRDMRMECSSEILRGFEPGYDATVVKLLRASGADVLGKTNCDEFGMGSMNVYSVHGPVVNPYNTPASTSTSTDSEEWTQDKARVAGGSSGGSAAAVAAGMCRVALGTDTGGSTRLPASYCGIVGLKPSYGLLSRWGVVSFADSLDCVGIFARDVDSAKEVFDVLNVYDARDPTSVSVEKRERASGKWRERVRALGKDRLDGVRVGVPREYFPREMEGDVVRALRRTLEGLRSRGAEIVPVSLPSTEYALSAYYVLASAEASSNLARYDGVQYGMNVRPPKGTDLSTMTPGQLYAYTRSAGFGPEVQRRILLGTYALSAGKFDNYFLQAQRVRELVRRDFGRVFGEVDVLVHGSAVRTAPRMGEELEGVEGYVQDVLTVPASLGGVPGLSVPVEGSDGWPVGVSIVGEWGSEEMLFSVGRGVNNE